MNRLVAFFEIPASDFGRAVRFYEAVFGVNLSVMDCETEKMAFFPNEEGRCPGAISHAPDFRPSKDGALISLAVEDISEAIERIESAGGKVTTPKTKIEAEDMGHFAVFTDTEGNRVGLYSDN